MCILWNFCQSVQISSNLVTPMDAWCWVFLLYCSRLIQVLMRLQFCKQTSLNFQQQMSLNRRELLQTNEKLFSLNSYSLHICLTLGVTLGGKLSADVTYLPTFWMKSLQINIWQLKTEKSNRDLECFLGCTGRSCYKTFLGKI